MKKLLMILGVVLMSLPAFASDGTKVNLEGTNKVKYYKLNVNHDRTVVLKGGVNQYITEALMDEMKWLNEESTANIFLIINSPGGSVVDGYELINVIRSIDAKVFCAIESEAYSMAALIASYCYRTYIHKNAAMMFHEASFSIQGSESEVDTVHTFIKKYLDGLALDVAKQLGISFKEFKKLQKDEWWMTAEEAARYGVVDGLLNELYYTAQPPPPPPPAFFFKFGEEDGTRVINPLRTR